MKRKNLPLQSRIARVLRAAGMKPLADLKRRKNLLGLKCQYKFIMKDILEPGVQYKKMDTWAEAAKITSNPVKEGGYSHVSVYILLNREKK